MDWTAAVEKFWNEWAAKNGIEAAEGWLELTPQRARDFAASFASEVERLTLERAAEKARTLYGNQRYDALDIAREISVLASKPPVMVGKGTDREDVHPAWRARRAGQPKSVLLRPGETENELTSAYDAIAEHDFSEDDIRRDGLPADVFGLLHDLCYHHDGRDVWNYVRRAQEMLRAVASSQGGEQG